MSDDKLTEFYSALTYLVEADSQNSQKHKRVKEWFSNYFNVLGRASVVSEKKQAYNRPTEQFKHKDPHAIFVYFDDDTLSTLTNTAVKHLNRELVTLLFVKKQSSSFFPRILWKRGESEVATFYMSTFSDLITTELELGETATEEADGEEDESDEQPKLLSAKWDGLSMSDSPCGLLGLGDAFRQAFTALRSGKHVILTGPPGTGKTSLAKCLCRSIGVPYTMASATSDWTTFDTIGGYLPNPAPAGQATIDFFPAIVLQSIEQQKWLIIDEINRADIDKAFGELFTLLSGSDVRLPFKKRVGDAIKDIVLLHHDSAEDESVCTYRIPKEWRMLGTMNTFDKASLYQLSFAFMRRFAFVDVPVPPRDTFEKLLSQEAATLLSKPGDTAFLDHCLPILKDVLAPPAGTGLDQLGLCVGPAIPLDVLRYLKSCKAIAGETSLDCSALILESFEMYLYPQFEGRYKQHAEILEIITKALDLNPGRVRATSKLLANFTGLVEGGSVE